MKYSALLLSAVVLLGAESARAELVTNGSFEQGPFGIGSFQSWQTNINDTTTTFVDSSGLTGSAYGTAYDGLWAAYFGSLANDGGASISQALTTTAGQTYSLTFELANDNGGLAPFNSLLVSVGGATAYSLADLADQSYQGYQFTFTASSNSTLLTFFGSNDNGFLLLDDVSVTATPVPASLALFLSGAVMLLGYRLRSTNWTF